MLEFIENLGRTEPPPNAASLTLDWDRRSRSRFLAELDGAAGEAGVALPHGSRRLAEGDVLRAAGGETAVVRCRPEELAVARAADWPALARAAWHFGNRHAAVQFDGLRLRFQPDPVLERLAAGLGLALGRETAVFEPEAGAGGPHSHAATRRRDGGGKPEPG
ncbi:MAG: urease accessory protein UreE [Planctomycetota bacterium]|jgi:urease accessory protein|nr:urease accessory protein UreE [Planctomycetota bacterium]